MKNMVFLFLALLLTCGYCVNAAAEAVADGGKTIVILATGGTIAGSGKQGKETGYKPGSLTVASLVEAVPGLGDIANIEAIQVCNVNSDDIKRGLFL